ncbi:MAG: tRNA pseudouridine(38-40) synthase TruA [Actinomycetota bacterium]|nr:tRNA pseudouridine(38-40) synthase TruA [Actinomycetota bacterium]
MTLFEEGTPPPSAPGPGPTQRIRMTVAYHGSGFHGFAANPGVTTVAGSLVEAIRKVLGHPVALTCAGRTDSGVHAWGQVVHFETAGDIDVDRLQRSLNKMLAPEVVVREASVSAADFDARRSATGRRYRYTVLNRPLPDPFLASTAWHVPEPLDLPAMQLACDPLFGEHDWSSFCRKPPAVDASMVRVVRDARWVKVGESVLRFDIEASAFCHQMVRSVVGMLVAIGQGKRRAGDVAWIIRSRDRALAGEPAPPHGLCLWEVLYE